MVSSSPLRERKKERTRTAITNAALALFSERGYEAVTLTEIADAEVGHRTLFRYFADKEELLFGDDDAVRRRLGEVIAARPPAEHAVTALREALVELSALWQGSAERGRRRQQLIAATPPLAARERAKHSAHEDVAG